MPTSTKSSERSHCSAHGRKLLAIEQVGAEHLAGVVQIGEKNDIEVKQLGQRDLLFSMQFGYENYANVIQTHPIVATQSPAYISNNDAFTYQTGLYNVLNLLQIGDDNTASVYQIDDNNGHLSCRNRCPCPLGRMQPSLFRLV